MTEKKPEAEIMPIDVIRSMLTQPVARLRALMSGEVEPPNEFVAYLISKARTCKKTFEGVQNDIQKVRKQLKQLEGEALRLEGQHNSYLQDIEAWDRALPVEVPGKSSTGEKPKEENDD